MGKHVQDSAPGLAGNQDHLRLPLALSVRTGLPQVGLCMTFNRILNFHVVRSTRPCQFTPASSPSIRDWGSLFLRIDRSDSGSGRARRVFGGPVSGDLVACPLKPCFTGKKEFRNLRDPGHVQRVPDG